MRIFPDINRFDIVFSIGEDCGCAMLLNDAGLRDMSSPFDWLTKATFATRMCERFFTLWHFSRAERKAARARWRMKRSLGEWQ